LRTITCLIVILVLSAPHFAFAYDVLVILSRRDQVYEEALNGYRRVRNFSERTIVLSDFVDVDITRVQREDRPSVILAVGDKALSLAKRTRHLPIVSLMALSFSRSGASPMATGVEFFVKPDQIVPIFSYLKARKVGVLFDPDKSGEYLRKSIAVASRLGVELVKREVSSPRDTINQLTQLTGSVDAVWMIPDAAAVNNRTVEAYFLFAQGQQIPLLSFDRYHLGSGAAVVVEPDRNEMGVQAGEMVAAVLDGTSISSLPPLSPRKFILKTNPAVLKRLNIPADTVDRLHNFGRE